MFIKRPKFDQILLFLMVGVKFEDLSLCSLRYAIVQTGSRSDSDSESRRQDEEMTPVKRLTPTVWTDPPEPATTIRTCTVKQKTFFVPMLGIGI